MLVFPECIGIGKRERDLRIESSCADVCRQDNRTRVANVTAHSQASGIIANSVNDLVSMPEVRCGEGKQGEREREPNHGHTNHFIEKNI